MKDHFSCTPVLCNPFGSTAAPGEIQGSPTFKDGSDACSPRRMCTRSNFPTNETRTNSTTPSQSKDVLKNMPTNLNIFFFRRQDTIMLSALNLTKLWKCLSLGKPCTLFITSVGFFILFKCKKM